jgi:PIN domain nuclease of toxin-antitoxin system
VVVTVTLLLGTHAVHWWSSNPKRLSRAAAAAVSKPDERAVADVSSIRTWLRRLAREVRTVPVTPAIAATAVELPDAFPGDPADRLIYATAVEHGWQLVTKDRRLRAHRYPRRVTIW